MPANFIDIHTHPALKTWLFPRHHLYDDKPPHNLKFSEKLFTGLPAMKQGNVNAGVSVYYLPEWDLDVNLMRHYFTAELALVLTGLCPKLLQRLEDRTTPDSAFNQTKEYIAMFEAEVAEARNKGFNASTAKTLAEFKEKIANGETVFLHSIEGAHCLGFGNVALSTIQQRVDELFALGICQFTLAHFFENILVSSQGGIPPGVRKFIHYTSGNTYAQGYNERENIGEVIVDQLLEKGIIIDLVHCTEGAKQMVYRRNNARATKRPLVFSHTGIRSVVLKYNPDFPYNDANYLPDDNDILEIQKCGGVLGVIFMDYWLTGKEIVAPAIDVIIETIQHIAKVSGNYENIAIGSDLDGFTEVPRDLSGSDKMPALINAMRQAGIHEADIDKICFQNYLRVLERGWGQ